jgi:hypothetical protein
LDVAVPKLNPTTPEKLKKSAIGPLLTLHDEVGNFPSFDSMLKNNDIHHPL